MGDGYAYISKKNGSGHFVLSSVDTDFLEKVAQCAFEILGRKPQVKFIRKAKNENSKDMYRIAVCSSDFARWLVSFTRLKGIVPGDILFGGTSVKKEFLQGLMDSEGCVTERSVSKSGKMNTPVLYFSVRDDWIVDIRNMMSELGIRVANFHMTAGQRRFSIGIISYVEAGMTFNIRRKADRLQRAYLSISAYELSISHSRQSFTNN